MATVNQQWRRVADQLNARMAEIPIEQAELARKSGVSDPTVRGLMIGKPRAANPRSGPLRKISAAVGWTPDSIERILAGGKPQLAGTTVTPRSTAVTAHSAVAEVGPKGDLDQVWSKLSELEQYLAGVASRLDDLTDAQTQLVEMAHTHEERRRGEDPSSGR